MDLQLNQTLSQKVPLDLVHKVLDEDVLVADMRDLLPSWIPAKVMEDTALSDEDRNLLSSLYNVERPALSGEDRVLGLSVLPHRLNEQDTGSLPKEMLEVIRQNYTHDPISGDWMLKSEYLSEIDLLALMGRFTERKLQLSDARRAHLSLLLDKVSSLVRPKVSCFSMVMYTRHSFFYGRKNHEHIPGMMLIEATRQCMYAHYYRHSGQKRSQVALTILNMSIDFSNFVNSNYPLRFQVEYKRADDAIGTKLLVSTATLWQLGRVVGVVSLRVNPIKINVFNRLRDLKPSPKTRFIPVKNIASIAAFTFDDGTALDGSVKDISTLGLCASFSQKSLIDVGTRARCALLVESLGFIHAEVEVRWSSLENESVRVGFRIVEIDTVSAGRLREAIKTSCFVKLSRGEPT